MGMFDTIECNYPLPISKELLDVEELDIYEVELQTKSFNNLMERYIISENGELFLFKNQYKWVDDDSCFLKGYMEETSSDLVKQNFHGIINFYFYESYVRRKSGNVKEFTVSGDYEAKFNDGMLVSIELVEHSIEDTTDHYLQMKQLFEERDRKAKLWYNNYIFYTKWFRDVKRCCIYNPLNGLHNFTGKLLSLSYRI